MGLRTDWKLIFRRAWSIRLMLLAAALSGCEVVFTVLTPELLGIPPGLFAAFAGLASAAATVFRLLTQPNLPVEQVPEEPK